MSADAPVHGAGLGLRRAHLGPLFDRIPAEVSFMEIAPENWLGAGGRLARVLERIAGNTPLVAHGLCLNLGGPDPLDYDYLQRLKRFLDAYDIRLFGDHVSYCASDGHLYELLPMPFTEEAAAWMAARIREVQDLLGRQITIENASYYCAPGQEMTEIDFLLTVLEDADCRLLLDINNVYVNSQNHGYDPVRFLQRLPQQRIAYAHIAGHSGERPAVIIDTHGSAVIDPVWALLDVAYANFGVFPTLLERDIDIPPLDELLVEVRRIADVQARYALPAARHGAAGA